jgi:hypothetical protein
MDRCSDGIVVGVFPAIGVGTPFPGGLLIPDRFLVSVVIT